LRIMLNTSSFLPHVLPTGGRSKLMVEQILKDFSNAYGLKYVSLRYFNAAGADPDGEVGEDHRPETHLIPLVLQTALGKRERIDIFGDDYPTKDGTCIRDYVHIADLAQASKVTKRRPGDPAVLIGSSKKIIRELGWKPQFADLSTIIETAWKWHKSHPEGW